jgi:hypothetical protein
VRYLLLLLLLAAPLRGEQLVVRDCVEPVTVSGHTIEGERYGILIYNCPEVTVRDNVINSFVGDKGAGGIVIIDSPGAIVYHNTVYSRHPVREGVGIRILNSDGSTVLDNLIDLRGERNQHDGEGITTNSSYVYVAGNVVRGAPGRGISIWGGKGSTGVTITNNIIVDPGYGLKLTKSGEWKNYAYPAVVASGTVLDATVSRNLYVHTGHPASREASTPYKGVTNQ